MQLRKKIAAFLTLAGMLVALMPLVAVADHGTPTPQGNCPVDGKVESNVDGDLDGIVLDAGIHVCVKGGQTTVFVTADGTSTLADLLGTGQNVSHYSIIEQPTTTTTTQPEETTTTVPEETTTTVPEKTTTTVPEETTTTQPEETTTTVPETTTTTRPEITELPFTGPADSLPWMVALGLGLMGLGGLLLRRGSQ